MCRSAKLTPTSRTAQRNLTRAKPSLHCIAWSNHNNHEAADGRSDSSEAWHGTARRGVQSSEGPESDHAAVAARATAQAAAGARPGAMIRRVRHDPLE